MFTINWMDVARGVAVAVFTGAFIAVVGVIGDRNFDVFSADWLSIGRDMVNGGFYAFVGYLAKNFFTGSNGKVAGII